MPFQLNDQALNESEKIGPRIINRTLVDPAYECLWQGIVGLWPLWSFVNNRTDGVVELGPNNHQGTITDFGNTAMEWDREVGSGGTGNLGYLNTLRLASGMSATNSDRVDLGNIDHPGTDQLTLAAYFNLDTNSGSVDCRIISKAEDWSTNDHFWMIGVTGINTTSRTARFRSRIRTGGTAVTALESGSSVIMDTWHLGVANYDGSDVRIWLDGEHLATVPKTGNIDTDNTVPAAIFNQGAGGGSSNHWQPWGGNIAWAGLWDWCWPSSMIRKVARDPFGLFRLARKSQYISVAGAPTTTTTTSSTTSSSTTSSTTSSSTTSSSTTSSSTTSSSTTSSSTTSSTTSSSTTSSSTTSSSTTSSSTTSSSTTSSTTSSSTTSSSTTSSSTTSSSTTSSSTTSSSTTSSSTTSSSTTSSSTTSSSTTSSTTSSSTTTTVTFISTTTTTSSSTTSSTTSSSTTSSSTTSSSTTSSSTTSSSTTSSSTTSSSTTSSSTTSSTTSSSTTSSTTSTTNTGITTTVFVPVRLRHRLVDKELQHREIEKRLRIR